MVHINKHTLVTKIKQHAESSPRVLIAVVGPPASGKSTFAESLRQDLGKHSCVLPMDGFHLDNTTLTNRGILHHKGAPHTFDVAAFVQLITTVKQAKTPIAYPTFDRSNDCVVTDGGCVAQTAKYIIVEGNYLLLNNGHWADVMPLWDISVYLHVPKKVLRQRLIDRWLYYGLSRQDAIKRAKNNDLKNAMIVKDTSAQADYTICGV